MVLLNTLSFCVILKRCLVNAYVCVPPQVTPLPGPTADSHMLCVQRCAWSCYEYITVADDVFVKCCQYNLNVIYIYMLIYSRYCGNTSCMKCMLLIFVCTCVVALLCICKGLL